MEQERKNRTKGTDGERIRNGKQKRTEAVGSGRIGLIPDRVISVCVPSDLVPLVNLPRANVK